MTAPLTTSFTESNRRSVDLAVPDASARLVTVIVSVVVMLTFLHGRAVERCCISRRVRKRVELALSEVGRLA